MKMRKKFMVLGHKFRPMTKSDREGFAGAADDALIDDRENDDGTVLIWTPSTGELHHINAEDGSEVVWKIVRC